MKSVSKKRPQRPSEGSVYQRKDGMWIAALRDNGKRTVVGSSKDEHAAIQKLTDHLKRRDAGLRPDANRWRLDDWLDYWLREHMAPQYAPNGERITGVDVLTYQKYESAIRLYVKPYLGRVYLTDLTPEAVEGWLRALNRAGHSADTQTNALQRLSSALDLARRRRYVEFNVAGVDWVTRPKLPTRKHVQPSEEDLSKLLAAIRGQPLEALVWVAMGSGLRRGEVAGLQWADITFIDAQSGVIRAHRRVNRVGKIAQLELGISGRLEREGLKTQDARPVHIGGMTVAALHQRWTHQLAERLAAGPAWRGVDYQAGMPSGYLFTNSVGMPLEVDKISKYLTTVRKLAGLDVNRFHALRRAFTTLNSVAGNPDRVTMAQAGHKHLDMTHYYQDPMESQKREAAQRLDVVLRRLAGEA